MNIVTNIVNKVHDKAVPFSFKIYNALSPDAVKLFAMFFTIWFLYQLIYHAMMKGDLKLPDVLKNFMLFSCISSFLKYGVYFKDWVITPIMDMVNGIILAILRNGLGERLIEISHSAYDQNAMLYAVDQCLNQIIGIYLGINHGANFYNLDSLVAGLFLIFPYLVMSGMFACYVLEYIFKVAAITAISPILLICIGFSPTRGAFTGGIRMIFQGAVNLIIAVFFMTLVLHVVHELVGELPNLEGRELSKATTAWLFSNDFWGCLIVGGIACLLLGKSPTIASAITNVADSSAAAAIVATTGAGMFMKTVAKTGGAVASRAGKMPSAMTKRAPDKPMNNAPSAANDAVAF